MDRPIQDQNEESLAIENVFGKAPSWIINWGISSVFVFLLVCLSIASFVKYPDKLLMNGSLYSENQPIEVYAKASTEIDTFLKFDKSFVTKGEVILIMNSNLEVDDLQLLKAFIQDFEKIGHPFMYSNLLFPRDLEVGPLNSLYADLQQKIEEFKSYLDLAIVEKRRTALQGEILQIKRLNNSLLKQKAFFQKTLSLTKKDFQRSKNLENEGVIAAIDKEKVELKLLSEEQQLEIFNFNLINNDLHIQQLKNQIIELETENANKISNKIFVIRQVIEQLKGEITNWEREFVVRASIAGEVAFSKNWAENQFVRVGELLFTIIPKYEGQKHIVEGQIPARGAGNLKLGQKAWVELESYPSNQYGLILGKVSDISSVPLENKYKVIIEIPVEMKTNFKIEIPKRQLLSAQVSIHTKEFSLIERLFQEVIEVILN